jgi:hypothetical protein
MKQTSRSLKIALAAVALVALAGTALTVVTQGASRTEADRVAGALTPGQHSDAKQAKEITDLVMSTGVGAALKRVEFYRDSRTGSCHDLSHVTGRAAWAKYGNVAQAFNAGYDVCDFGYFHGIVEAAGAEMTPEEFKSRIPGMCGELRADYLRYSQCAHGSGHGAFYLAQGDMEAAMELCSGFPRDDQGVTSGCETGVSMEWFAVYESDSSELTPKVTDRRMVCGKIAEKYQSSCYDYLYTGGVELIRTDADIAREAAWCKENAGGRAGECIASLARYAVVGLKKSPLMFNTLCPETEPGRAACVTIAMLMWTLHTGPTMVEYDAMCAKFRPEDTGPDGGCTRLRPQVEQTVERGATNAPDRNRVAPQG